MEEMKVWELVSRSSVPKGAGQTVLPVKFVFEIKTDVPHRELSVHSLTVVSGPNPASVPVVPSSRRSLPSPVMEQLSHASSYAPPAHAASSSASPDPLDLQAALEQNARMQNAGIALQRQVAALEAEKAALLAVVASARSVAPVAGSHGRPKGPVPPEFHGTKVGGYEVDAWIRDMKVHAPSYGAREFPDDAAKVRHAAMFLKGRAAEWWEAEDKYTGVEASWDAFVARLHDRYRPMQAAVVARERLDRLKQKGTVSA